MILIDFVIEKEKHVRFYDYTLYVLHTDDLSSLSCRCIATRIEEDLVEIYISDFHCR